MAKPKSLKLRFLVTLHALYKYSDKNHRISSTKLNEYLRPYGLECSRRVLVDTVTALREYGIDIQSQGTWDQRGVWMESRPLSEDVLKQLAFAVSTNPYLSKTQVSESLSALNPFVTAYQEPMLESNIETLGDFKYGKNFFNAYTTVCEALRLKRRLLYTVNQVGYDRKTGEIYSREQWRTLFTPKCLYKANQTIYMVGYNHSDKHVGAVDLSEIVSIKITLKHNDPNAENVRDLLEQINPEEYIHSERDRLLYKGPVTFKCRGQHLKDLVDKFGMPDEPISKNKCGHTTFILHDAEIKSSTLTWLMQIPRQGIRIKGPAEASDAVKRYYTDITDTLLSARLMRECV